MTPKAKYKLHKQNAKKRGVEFILTFDEWLLIWWYSGKFSRRGAKRGYYVMARYGDVGPYSKENVRIILHEENVSEMKRPWWNSESHRRKTSIVHKGKIVSEETRHKMRLAKLGKLGNNKGGYKLNLSPEARQRRSEHLRQRNLENNPMKRVK